MDGGDRYDLNKPRDLSNVYSQREIDAMNDEETVDALNGMWSNFCVTDAYEPGSVVKPIVMGSALEMGAISESDNFVCDGGQSFWSGRCDYFHQMCGMAGCSRDRSSFRCHCQFLQRWYDADRSKDGKR